MLKGYVIREPLWIYITYAFILKLTTRLFNDIPIFHWWNHHNSPMIMIPLSSCFWYFYPPLTSMKNGNSPWQYSAPCSLCIILKTYLLFEDYAHQFGAKNTPSLCQRYSNLSLRIGFMNISTIYSFVPIYSNMMLFFLNCSSRKWNMIAITFFLEYITGFLDIFIELVLS